MLQNGEIYLLIGEKKERKLCAFDSICDNYAIMTSFGKGLRKILKYSQK